MRRLFEGGVYSGVALIRVNTVTEWRDLVRLYYILNTDQITSPLAGNAQRQNLSVCIYKK